MRKLILWPALVLLAGGGAFWALTAPRPLAPDAVAGLAGDPVRGEQVFWAGGCTACHADAKAEGAAKLQLGGGQEFPSPFGTFVAPNISPDPVQGIGGWTVADLANAMTRGVSPDGRHYYPVFPYASFANVRLQDVADLHAFLMTLPPVATPSRPHKVGFPFNIRRGLGLWKLLYLDRGWVISGTLTAEQERGRYLVEGLGHCGECHTPRGPLGGMERDHWLAGAPIPGAKGRFPNITPAKLTWSAANIVEYLTSGFTPQFDSVGGHMALVVEDTAHLPPSDRAAIAAYLKIVPPQP
ncbi:MAG: cytochrome c [Proteobacteria bacterium]|nr:cytochrome c [Pseudomonadota bacterium]MBS0573620.1 cytochrome c [Pseudomonadota bacterium]